jgi:hypothetical protein
MTVHEQAIATTPDREIVITRTFDAPRELVFAVWTDPRHLVHWWGPSGSTTTIQEARDTVIKTYGAVEGGKQTLGRLAGYLAMRDGAVP